MTTTQLISTVRKRNIKVVRKLNGAVSHTCVKEESGGNLQPLFVYGFFFDDRKDPFSFLFNII